MMCAFEWVGSSYSYNSIYIYIYYLLTSDIASYCSVLLLAACCPHQSKGVEEERNKKQRNRSAVQQPKLQKVLEVDTLWHAFLRCFNIADHLAMRWCQCPCFFAEFIRWTCRDSIKSRTAWLIPVWSSYFRFETGCLNVMTCSRIEFPGMGGVLHSLRRMYACNNVTDVSIVRFLLGAMSAYTLAVLIWLREFRWCKCAGRSA